MIKRKLTKRKLEIKPNYEILTTRTPKWSFGEGYSITNNKDKDKDQIKIKKIKIRSSTPAPNSYIRRTMIFICNIISSWTRNFYF